MAGRDEMVERQRVLADFGELASRSENLDEVLTEARRLVGRALGTDLAKAIDVGEGEQTLFVRAGCGWRPGMVGQVRLAMSDHSSVEIVEGAAEVQPEIAETEGDVAAPMRRSHDLLSAIAASGKMDDGDGAAPDLMP